MHLLKLCELGKRSTANSLRFFHICKKNNDHKQIRKGNQFCLKNDTDEAESHSSKNMSALESINETRELWSLRS